MGWCLMVSCQSSALLAAEKVVMELPQTLAAALHPRRVRLRRALDCFVRVGLQADEQIHQGMTDGQESTSGQRAACRALRARYFQLPGLDKRLPRRQLAIAHNLNRFASTPQLRD